MKLTRLLTLLITFAALFSGRTLNAQTVTYHFTGTSLSSSEGVGTTIAGSLTLDVAAVPEGSSGSPDGHFAVWRNGNFKANAITDTGFTTGSDLGGTTTFQVYDVTAWPLDAVDMDVFSDDGVRQRSIRIYSGSANPGDGLVEVPNPWDPLAYETQFIYVSEYDRSTELFTFGLFTIDTFEMVIPNIIVNGVDTGIQDFQYGGKSITQTLADFAAKAKNHGAYVSSVSRFTTTLVRAGLLTCEQRSLILSIAVKAK